jgi:hypothetical protein
VSTLSPIPITVTNLAGEFPPLSSVEVRQVPFARRKNHPTYLIDEGRATAVLVLPRRASNRYLKSGRVSIRAQQFVP